MTRKGSFENAPLGMLWSYWDLNRGREVNMQLPKVAKPPTSALAPASASSPAAIRGDVTEWSEPTSAQFVANDINLPSLEELVDDDLETLHRPPA